MSVARSSGAAASAWARQSGWRRERRPAAGQQLVEREDVRALARPRRTRSRGGAPAGARGSTSSFSSCAAVDTKTATAPESRRMYCDLAGGQRGVDRHVGGTRGQAGVVGDRPLRPVLGEDRHAVAVAHAQLAQADARGVDPLGELAVVERRPAAVPPDAHRHRAGGERLDGVEVELGQRARRGSPYGAVNRMMKRCPEPAPAAPRGPLGADGHDGAVRRRSSRHHARAWSSALPSDPVGSVSATPLPCSRTVGVPAARVGRRERVDHAAAGERDRARGVEVVEPRGEWRRRDGAGRQRDDGVAGSTSVSAGSMTAKVMSSEPSAPTVAWTRALAGAHAREDAGGGVDRWRWGRRRPR